MQPFLCQLSVLQMCRNACLQLLEGCWACAMACSDLLVPHPIPALASTGKIAPGGTRVGSRWLEGVTEVERRHFGAEQGGNQAWMGSRISGNTHCILTTPDCQELYGLPGFCQWYSWYVAVLSVIYTLTRRRPPLAPKTHWIEHRPWHLTAPTQFRIGLSVNTRNLRISLTCSNTADLYLIWKINLQCGV